MLKRGRTPRLTPTGHPIEAGLMMEKQRRGGFLAGFELLATWGLDS